MLLILHQHKLSFFKACYSLKHTFFVCVDNPSLPMYIINLQCRYSDINFYSLYRHRYKVLSTCLYIKIFKKKKNLLGTDIVKGKSYFYKY